MATAGDVIDAALYRLDESTSSPIFWSRAELLIFVNDGFLEFTLIAGQMVSENPMTLANFVNLQNVPTGAIAIIHVSRNSVMVEKVSLEHLDREDPGWQSKSGTPREWVPVGLNHWIVDRTPLVNTVVSVTTLDEPALLAEDDDIDLAEEYVDALIDYVFHMARFKEGGAEFAQAVGDYDSFRNKAGLREQRTFSEQWLLWARDPAADTGEDYSTMDRS